MEFTLILILMPGLVAVGVSKIFSGDKSRPVNEIVTDLVFETVCVYISYEFVSRIKVLELPRLVEVGVALVSYNSNLPIDEKLHIAQSFGDLLFTTFVLALVIGFLSALAREINVVQKISKRFWIFQSNHHESAWKTMFTVGSQECWVQIDTKGGIRYLGEAKTISWQEKDGGIGLENVSIYIEDNQQILKVAEYIYIPSAELDGPVLFIKGQTIEKEKQK